MPISRSSYMLKRFTSSQDPDFAKALLLYVRNTTPDIRTDTNEISYWLEEFTPRFDHPFYVFGFYRNRDLVGYAEAAYFAGPRLFALDYIVIDALHRRNNVFCEFLDHLRDFLEEAHPDYRYAVAEVCYGPGQTVPSPTARLLTRLLKLHGFQVIKSRYYQPKLTMDYVESEMCADLLIYSATHLETIHTETFTEIVSTLYYKYYLAWQDNAPASRQERYKRYIDGLYSKLEANLRGEKTISVNGHQHVLATPTESQTVSHRGIVTFSIMALVVIVLLAAALLGLKAYFGLSDSSFITMYGLAIISFFAVTGVVSKE